MNIEELGNLITCEYTEHDTPKLKYIDMKTENGQMSVDVLTKNVELGNDLKEDYSVDLYEEIKKLTDIKDKKTFSISSEDSPRKWEHMVNMASNMIAGDGRIGPGNTVLISEKNYNNKLSKLGNIYNVQFIDNEDEIFVYKKTNLDQPGLAFIYNDDKYAFVSKGFFPDKQVFKIEIKS